MQLDSPLVQFKTPTAVGMCSLKPCTNAEHFTNVFDYESGAIFANEISFVTVDLLVLSTLDIKLGICPNLFAETSEMTSYNYIDNVYIL